MPVEGVRRPILDPAVCPPARTYEASFVDFTLDPFSISRDPPKALQVITDEAGFDGAFVLLIRFPTTPDGDGHRGGAVCGDPLLTAAFVLDQPAPYSHGVRGDTVLSLSNLRHPPDAPTLDDIIEADPQLWAELLDPAAEGT